MSNIDTEPKQNVLLDIKPVEELEEDELPQLDNTDPTPTLENEIEKKEPTQEDIFIQKEVKKPQQQQKPKKQRKKRVMTQKDLDRLAEMRKKAVLVRKAKALKRKEEREAKKKLANERREAKEQRERENEKLINNYKEKTKPIPQRHFLDDMSKFFIMMDKYEEYKERRKIRTKPKKPEKRVEKTTHRGRATTTNNPLVIGSEWDKFF